MRYEIPIEPKACPKCGRKDRRGHDTRHTLAPVRNRYYRRQTWACGHLSFQTWVQEYGEAVVPTDRELHEMSEFQFSIPPEEKT